MFDNNNNYLADIAFSVRTKPKPFLYVVVVVVVVVGRCLGVAAAAAGYIGHEGS